MLIFKFSIQKTLNNVIKELEKENKLKNSFFLTAELLCHKFLNKKTSKTQNIFTEQLFKNKFHMFPFNC